MPAPVPDLLHGAWRRVSIVNDDGTSDTSSTVLWLQLESEMVDVRIPAEVMALAARGPEACDDAALELLATCEASSGFTTCTDVEVGADGVRRATAEWHTRGPGDLAIHPATAYPEPGELEWNDDGSVMIERAPSGAYVEEWHRLPGSDAVADRFDGPAGRVYVIGDVAVVARDDRGDGDSLLDVEFSIRERIAGGAGWRIVASTLPWRTGEVIDVGVR